MKVIVRRMEVLILGWRTLLKVMLISRDGQLNACMAFALYFSMVQCRLLAGMASLVSA